MKSARSNRRRLLDFFFPFSRSKIVGERGMLYLFERRLSRKHWTDGRRLSFSQFYSKSIRDRERTFNCELFDSIRTSSSTTPFLSLKDRVEIELWALHRLAIISSTDRLRDRQVEIRPRWSPTSKEQIIDIYIHCSDIDGCEGGLRRRRHCSMTNTRHGQVSFCLRLKRVDTRTRDEDRWRPCE